MTQQYAEVAPAVPGPVGRGARPVDGRETASLVIDIVVIEAGLRLKVLPLRDAALRGRKLAYSGAQRDARRRAWIALCGGAFSTVVDVGLFADAVARRPDVARRLRRALRRTG